MFKTSLLTTFPMTSASKTDSACSVIKGHPVIPSWKDTLDNLSKSLPDQKPKGPKKVIGADSSKTDAENTLLFTMSS